MPDDLRINAEVDQVETESVPHKREFTLESEHATLRIVAKPKPKLKLDPARLNALMKRAGVGSDNQFGAWLGKKQIGRWRAGEHPPGGDSLTLMCERLECSPSYLMGRNEDMCADLLVKIVAREIGEAEGMVLATMLGQRRLQAAQAVVVAGSEIHQTEHEKHPPPPDLEASDPVPPGRIQKKLKPSEDSDDQPPQTPAADTGDPAQQPGRSKKRQRPNPDPKR